MKEQHKAMFMALRDGQLDYLFEEHEAPSADGAGALTDFERAVSVVRGPRYLFNVCLAHEALEQFERALDACEQVRSLEPPASLSAKIEQRIAIIREVFKDRPNVKVETFSGLLARLPDSTRIFPGHEYLVRNLEFTLDREPGNAAAQDLLARVRVVDPAEAPVTTLADERCINTFMRLDSATLIERLRAAYPDLDPHPDARTVFLRLRELRNRW